MKSIVEFLINNKSTGIIKINKSVEFVDLGLSVLWAKCNIGAKEETEFGNYYQWGGLEPIGNKDCDWSTAPFNNGCDNLNIKYFNYIKNSICHNEVLSKEYDVAYKTYGNKCHIPTVAEYEDLILKTLNKWYYNYNDTGINGVKFINRSDNSKFIFIPASGYRLQLNKFDFDSEIRIWSSTLSNERYSYTLIYDYNDFNVLGSDRCIGTPVRAVKEK